MVLKVGSHSLVVEKALLSGLVFHKRWQKDDPTINPGVNYSLYIKCKEKNIGGETWQPLMEFDRFHIDVKEWAAIAGTTLHDIEGAAQTTHHGEVIARQLTFGERTGLGFETSIEGECNRLPFSFNGMVTFDGYLVKGTSRDKEAALTKLLEQHVSLNGLEPCESKDLPPTKMRLKEFRPLENF